MSVVEATKELLRMSPQEIYEASMANLRTLEAWRNKQRGNL